MVGARQISSLNAAAAGQAWPNVTVHKWRSDDGTVRACQPACLPADLRVRCALHVPVCFLLRATATRRGVWLLGPRCLHRGMRVFQASKGMPQPRAYRRSAQCCPLPLPHPPPSPPPFPPSPAAAFAAAVAAAAAAALCPGVAATWAGVGGSGPSDARGDHRREQRQQQRRSLFFPSVGGVHSLRPRNGEPLNLHRCRLGLRALPARHVVRARMAGRVVCLSVSQSVSQSVCLSVCLCFCLHTCLPVFLFNSVSSAVGLSCCASARAHPVCAFCTSCACVCTRERHASCNVCVSVGRSAATTCCCPTIEGPPATVGPSAAPTSTAGAPRLVTTPTCWCVVGASGKDLPCAALAPPRAGWCHWRGQHGASDPPPLSLPLFPSPRPERRKRPCVQRPSAAGQCCARWLELRRLRGQPGPHQGQDHPRHHAQVRVVMN
jgi:hypothetical protein